MIFHLKFLLFQKIVLTLQPADYLLAITGCQLTQNNMYDHLLEKAIEDEYPGLLDGSRLYDFNDAESLASQRRYDEISSIMEASFGESGDIHGKVVISNDEYHFI